MGSTVIHGFNLDGTRAFATRQVARMLKMFLSHRTDTQNSLSPNHKPVPRGCKIVGKTEWEKKCESSNHDWLVITFYWIRYMNNHFHVWSSPCKQKHTRTWSFTAVDFYWQFSFHHAIQFHPIEHISTRSMPAHSKRLPKVEAISFPMSKHFQSTAELDSPTS